MDFKKMSSAPKDGRPLMLQIRHGFTNEKVTVYGCWMAPHSDPSLEGWWSAGFTTGSLSLKGLPYACTPVAITPIGWAEVEGGYWTK